MIILCSSLFCYVRVGAPTIYLYNMVILSCAHIIIYNIAQDDG